MGDAMQDLISKLAAGEVPSGNFGPKVGPGIYTVLVTAATLGPGQAGSLRAMVTCKVIGGGTDQQIGGIFQIYVSTKGNERFLLSDLQTWTNVLKAAGYPQDKLVARMADAKNPIGLLNELVTIANMMAIDGKLKLVVNHTPQTGKNAAAPNGNPYYDNFILEVIPEGGAAVKLGNGPRPSQVPQTAPVTPAHIAAVTAMTAPAANDEWDAL